MSRIERLSDAIGIRKGDLVAFVGAGGKTGAILVLTAELRGRGWTVLASTTTKVGRRLGTGMPVILAGASCDGETRRRAVAQAKDALVNAGSAFIAADETDAGKLSGISPEWLDQIRAEGIADAMLVEADGARQRSFKLPDAHEPVVPARASVVVPIAALDVLGQEISELTAHRHELVRAYAGSDLITADLLIRFMTDDAAGLKGLPEQARCVPMLTRVDHSATRAGRQIASGILSARPDRIKRVVLADLRANSFSIAIRAEG